MDANDSGNPLGPLSRGALRHHVVQRLLKAIIRGELAAGTRLIANKLAAQFAVSATPVREALVELQQSGIVELQHNRGALVRPFGRKEVRDFYAVRRLLECEAVRLACGHVDHELLSLLKYDLERMAGPPVDGQEKWVKDFVALDQRVHGVAVDHCSNKRLATEINRYTTLGEAMRDLIGQNRAAHQESIASLVDLLHAMQTHQAEAGAEAMGRHINVVTAIVETVMFDGNNGKPK
jgi:DNA-binding GntR family transcriptional regulator